MGFAHHPLKRFGQNFLIDRNIIRKIIDVVDIGKGDCVLEIGPGAGALTQELSARAKHLLIVEVDKLLAGELFSRYRGEARVDVLCQDILKVNLKQYGLKHRIKSFKVVANLPYYITTPIIEYFFRNIALFNDIYIMVQKEVAQRMLARPSTGEYSAFACFVNYFSQPSILFNVSRGCFRPSPKVDSCFVRLKPYGGEKRGVRVKSETLFFDIVRSSFGQRRKQLLSSLPRVVDRAILQRVAPKEILLRRPEDLSMAEFAELSNSIYAYQSATMVLADCVKCAE